MVRLVFTFIFLTAQGAVNVDFSSSTRTLSRCTAFRRATGDLDVTRDIKGME